MALWRTYFGTYIHSFRNTLLAMLKDDEKKCIHLMICMKWFRVHRPSVFLFDRDFPTNVKFDLIVMCDCVIVCVCMCLCAFPKWNRSFHSIQVDILVGNCHYQCNCEGLMKLANGLFIVNISWPGSERRKSEELEFESWKFLVKNLNGNYVAFSAMFTILHVYLYICVIVRQFAIPTGMFKTCFKLDIYFE